MHGKRSKVVIRDICCNAAFVSPAGGQQRCIISKCVAYWHEAIVGLLTMVHCAVRALPALTDIWTCHVVSSYTTSQPYQAFTM